MKKQVVYRALSLVTATVLGGVMIAGSAVTYAADVTSTNSNTGADSTNTVTVVETNTTDITQNNTSDSTNTVTLTLNSGGNTISDNTEVGPIATGDIDFEVNVATVANNNPFLISPDNTTTTTVVALNTNTGSNSTNTTTVSNSNTVSLTQTNTSTIDNDAVVDVDTGNNTITDNTKVGSITTGSINGSITFSNVANSTPPVVTPPVTPPGVGGDGGTTPPVTTTSFSVTPTTTSTPATVLTAAVSNPLTAVAANQPAFFAAGAMNGLIPLYVFLVMLTLGMLSGIVDRFARRARLNLGSNLSLATTPPVRISVSASNK